jgi:hypothetical protein
MLADCDEMPVNKKYGQKSLEPVTRPIEEVPDEQATPLQLESLRAATDFQAHRALFR